MASITRYTRFVALSKHSLWMLVALLVGAVVWIASGGGEGEAPRMVFSKPPEGGNLESVMVKPHYQGIDADNRPYTVIADRATQIDKDTVAMENVSADMLKDDNGKATWLALNAGSGTLNTVTRQMELKGGVSLFYEGGYEFRSDRARVDIAKGAAYGDAAVEGQGPMGTLTADGFEVAGHGRSIRFNGSVRMKLYP